MLTIFCFILQLQAATTTGLWLANLCLLQTEGRVYIIPASIFWRSKSMTWLDVICTFVLETKSINDPVFFWIFSAWTRMKCQEQQCVQRHSAQLAGVLKASCLIPTLYSRSETPKMSGKGLLQNARSCCKGMDSHAIAAKNGYGYTCHTTCVLHIFDNHMNGICQIYSGICQKYKWNI